jgi:hypothetical protein
LLITTCDDKIYKLKCILLGSKSNHACSLPLSFVWIAWKITHSKRLWKWFAFITFIYCLQSTPFAFKYTDVLFFNYERPVKISVCFSVAFTCSLLCCGHNWIKVAAFQLLSFFKEQKDIEWKFILNCGELNVISVAVWIIVV